MAIARRACTNIAAICLFLCYSALVSCEVTTGEATGKFNVSAANAHANAINRGILDPTAKVFNVLQFGAKPGDKEDRHNIDSNHMAFVKAFEAACHHEGKARLVIPRGTFVIGPVTFMGPCSNTPLIVQIQGTIKALTDISEFPGQGEEWVNFQNINGLVVTGGGTFDGQGASCWKYRFTKDDNNAPSQRLPANIQFVEVSNAIVRGITSVNSKGFHYFITGCKNIRLYHLNITAPDESPNTDGIHISQSDVVKIAKSYIGTGDDCVGMIRGSSNVSVKKVTCGPGHGISVGSLGKYDNETDVKGIIVKDCTLVGTQNGLRIKTYEGKSASRASSMIFQDIVMKNVKHPIIIDQFYGGKDKDSIVKINDIQFINITGTSVSKVAVDIACSKHYPCQNVHLSSINLKYNGNDNDQAPFSSSCVNAHVGYHGLQLPPPCR
ncbi:hypothetical protein AB3S75_046302 [Citrus x aurantiifolia]